MPRRQVGHFRDDAAPDGRVVRRVVGHQLRRASTRPVLAVIAGSSVIHDAASAVGRFWNDQ
ncbi:hypothetical protein C6A85_000000102255 [Mycobacterium sp. ITM-2017-0098]|nr:hypothetical protein C6A85_000000102255 [Mycobacterium sp. ITM-2017-0098]